MPQISVIVTAHGVAEQLPACLDSILCQPHPQLEVIAVDDCSPDECGQIIDAYAGKDPRLKASHLRTNVGQGRARGAGFAVASGEYAWFVDGDDEIAPGSIQAIADHLDRFGPELLLLDYERVPPTGSPHQSDLSRTLPAGQTPDVFTAAGVPEVVGLTHTAWSRVAHRGLLLRAGLPFHSGWYEDVSFSFPLLVAARRISVLREVCYRFREGRPGAISTTTSERHLEIFDQYERLFATLDRWRIDSHGDVRTRIFERMLLHYRWLLNSSVLVPPQRQRSFFARMSEHLQLFQPFTAPPQPPLETFKRTLIAHDSWLTFAALHTVRKFGATAHRRLRELVPTERSASRHRRPASDSTR